VPSIQAADLTMVVPTYNERGRLEELVKALFAAAASHRIDLELIVVDDNSPDGTGELADRLATTRRMRVIHRAGKLGLGTAVVEGFRLASADVVGAMDADFSHPPGVVPRLLAAMRATGADVVVASRYVRGGGTSNWPLRRRFMSRLACVLARPLSPIRDATSGFFVMRRVIATGADIKAGGFKICLELLVRAWPIGLVEMPYEFEDRTVGESKMSRREATEFLSQLKDLFLARWSTRRRPARRYQQLSVEDVNRAVTGRPA
jgi:dolichol-phosphate mannosyltransferase